MSQKTEAVDAYIEDLEPSRRAALTELRSLVLESVPNAVETFRYKMPTYEQDGAMLCVFASQKHYMSWYMDVELVKKHKDELAGLDIGKSCIRFRSLEQLPLGTVEMILRETARKGEWS
jgi:uncharacterized protein YdhG (YjbR/CyaY superfamily)